MRGLLMIVYTIITCYFLEFLLLYQCIYLDYLHLLKNFLKIFVYILNI